MQQIVVDRAGEVSCGALMAPDLDAIDLISAPNQDPHETNKLKRCRDVRRLLFEPVLRHCLPPWPGSRRCSFVARSARRLLAGIGPAPRLRDRSITELERRRVFRPSLLGSIIEMRSRDVGAHCQAVRQRCYRPVRLTATHERKNSDGSGFRGSEGGQHSGNSTLRMANCGACSRPCPGHEAARRDPRRC